MIMQTPLVACRPPLGTNVFPQRATLPRQIPHLRSTVPPRSQPRTADDPHAAPRGAGLAIEEHPALTDPIAASASSSQPPLSGCCDDRLNPPWTPRSEWWMRPGGGVRCPIAIIRAFSHNELFKWSAMLQPTISRVAMSLTAARYSQPSSVATYVMSASQIVFGRSASKARWSRFGAMP